MREITRKIDEQINSVRRELANMLSVGIIKSETSNNRLYYEINTDYPYYAPFRQIFADEAIPAASPAAVAAVASEKTVGWAKRIKPLGDVRVLVFAGALVRGSQSTLDVMIAGDINKTQAKKFVAELELEEKTPINYSVLSYEDFYYRLSIRDRFVADLVNSKHSVIVDTENIL